MFSRIYLKLYLSFLVIFLLTLLTVLFIATRFHTHNLREEVEGILTSHARFISTQYAQSCADKDSVECASFVQRLSEVEGWKFWIVDGLGEAVYKNDKPPRVSASEISEAASGDASIVRHRRGRPLVVVQVPDLENRYLIIQSNFPAGRRRLERFPLGFWLILTGSLIAIMVLPLSLRITGPIRRLHKIGQEWAEGRLDQRVQIRGRDEIAQLAGVFNLMAANLEKTLQVRTESLALISHELKSPLARMRIALELLSERHEQSSETMRILEGVKNEINESEQLIEQLLVLSRVEMTLPSGVNETVDLKPVLKRAVEHSRMVGDKKQIKIEMDEQPGEIKVKGEAAQLQRAFLNVIDNALKYSPASSKIEIRVSSADGYAIVEVQDSGEGIADADRAKIFEPFYRGASSVQKEGAGLGLYIAKKILDLHRGSIKALPSPVGGTIIRIQIPQ